jgi:hypothetical protein
VGVISAAPCMFMLGKYSVEVEPEIFEVVRLGELHIVDMDRSNYRIIQYSSHTVDFIACVLEYYPLAQTASWQGKGAQSDIISNGLTLYFIFLLLALKTLPAIRSRFENKFLIFCVRLQFS